MENLKQDKKKSQEIDNKRRVEDLKIAIIHDELNVWGGAEDVTNTLLEVFPQADFYTSVFDQKLKINGFLILI
jgi:hypothetical protein